MPVMLLDYKVRDDSFIKSAIYCVKLWPQPFDSLHSHVQTALVCVERTNVQLDSTHSQHSSLLGLMSPSQRRHWLVWNAATWFVAFHDDVALVPALITVKQLHWLQYPTYTLLILPSNLIGSHDFAGILGFWNSGILLELHGILGTGCHAQCIPTNFHFGRGRHQSRNRKKSVGLCSMGLRRTD